MFRPVIRPCRNCLEVISHTFLGKRCPSCQVTNWKYQSYVIPLAILVGTIVVAAAIIMVLNKF